LIPYMLSLPHRFGGKEKKGSPKNREPVARKT
jgi:hypothetical protein